MPANKTAIKISFSFHKYQSMLIINHLSVKGEFEHPNSTTAIMGNDKRTNCAYHRTIYLELKQQ